MVICDLFFNGQTISGRLDNSQITMNGITNPTTASTTNKLTVSTTSDTAIVKSSPYSVGSPPPRPVVSGVSPAEGPAAGGTNVTISGSGFSSATTVKFGLTTGGASITGRGPDYGSPRLPRPGSGTVDVTVSGPGGTSADSAADQFTYQTAADLRPRTSSGTADADRNDDDRNDDSRNDAGNDDRGGRTRRRGRVEHGPEQHQRDRQRGVNPNGQPTTAHFDYGLDPTLRQTPGPLIRPEHPAQTVGADTSGHNMQAHITGLIPNAEIPLPARGDYSAGTTTGPDQTFTTPTDPARHASRDRQDSRRQAARPGSCSSSRPTAKRCQRPPTDSAETNLTKGNGFLPLTEARQIPSGSTIDARAGTLQLVTATGNRAKSGKTQAGIFNGGLFNTTQAASGITKGLTTLTLLADIFPGAPSYSSCRANRALTGLAAALRIRPGSCKPSTPGTTTANSAPRVATAPAPSAARFGPPPKNAPAPSPPSTAAPLTSSTTANGRPSPSTPATPTSPNPNANSPNVRFRNPEAHTVSRG